MVLDSRGLAVPEERPGEVQSRGRGGGRTMARENRKAELRARIGLEGLEGRDLPSSLVGGAAAGALIQLEAATASAYQTTVWDRSDEGLSPLPEEDGFSRIKVESATVEGEFLTVKVESAPIEILSGKATPILF